MSLDTGSRDVSSSRRLAERAASGEKLLLLAPLGAGKTHALRAAFETLRARSVPSVWLDLFTAASTPEQLLKILADAVGASAGPQAEEVAALAAIGRDRHEAGPALLRLLKLISRRPPSWPQVFLIDEITEIRSLAYFPGLAGIETPFAEALRAARGVLATSSYPGLAADTFNSLEAVPFPGLSRADLKNSREQPDKLNDALQTAVELTRGAAATLLPLAEDLRDSHDLEESLVHLLSPGGALEAVARRHYEVLLLRSRGYAVSKRAAEAVAGRRDARLTDLYPAIGRTAGASRQYLRWLVEVGLLVQNRKRYDFADPILGLWASLYLGRGQAPTAGEIRTEVKASVDRIEAKGAKSANEGTQTDEGAGPHSINVKKRIERLEEID